MEEGVLRHRLAELLSPVVVGVPTRPRVHRAEEEVLFVQGGQLEIEIDGVFTELGAGDTFSTPMGASRTFRNASGEPCLVFVTRRGDQPSKPEFM